MLNHSSCWLVQMWSNPRSIFFEWRSTSNTLPQSMILSTFALPTEALLCSVSNIITFVLISHNISLFTSSTLWFPFSSYLPLFMCVCVNGVELGCHWSSSQVLIRLTELLQSPSEVLAWLRVSRCLSSLCFSSLSIDN